ncbi:hypothetical protein EG328_009527 [Venturia inaequalis]|uniref:Secreted protein n=1 Tax=Venturia inaequalis TaxID=5025 RepID=A0A8H3Z7F6_VENIN|nr:hypothetical protein EG328_009527 [Venturia inaequalis]KAE9985943.1 hypothetical protein EG327_004510 [Venturia inaequalis]RDI77748.1 hypothetical protein Vi05172_g12263 [Venturia inaequalis]
MYFQTLLPAILFAQYSFAYTCCFEFVGKGYYDNFAENLNSGSVQVWQPYGSSDCQIMVNKSGKTCADWKYSIAQNSCAKAKPFKHIGVTTANKCK